MNDELTDQEVLDLFSKRFDLYIPSEKDYLFSVFCKSRTTKYLTIKTALSLKRLIAKQNKENKQNQKSMTMILDKDND